MIDDFGGTTRFQVLRSLGAGASGVVYEVLDTERGERVALKTLTNLSPASLYRFKREFRALADLQHPNLVRLHELFAEEGSWYFTMALVIVEDFLQWVRGPEYQGPTADTVADEPFEAFQTGGVPSTRRHWDEARLRQGLADLVRGLTALHEADLLHRDVKPNNVLVQPDGRVVLVDFGIAADLKSLDETESATFMGTPAYMAPEQATANPLSPASDLYSLGVMLFEAVTGCLPFEGKAVSMLMAKAANDGPSPKTLDANLPEDLCALCTDLMKLDPARRPSAQEILSRLGGESVEVRETASTHSARSVFVGRQAALSALNERWERASGGHLSIVAVRGAAGVGKTALIRRFLEQVDAAEDIVILEGRCYERESVPFKGFDAVVDALTHVTRRMASADRMALMPRDLPALTKVFPVLLRVKEFAATKLRVSTTTDPQRLRARAFSALREMLVRLLDRKPVVLFIDDLQWGDADSTRLLAELVAPPEPPPLLVILGMRSGEPAAESVIDVLRGEDGSTPLLLDLDVLGEAEAFELATRLLGGAAERDESIASKVAEESGGSPLFLSELVQWVKAHPGVDSTAEAKLENVLRSRIGELPESARALIEVVGVAGRPLAREVAYQAAELPPTHGAQALAALRAAKLVRVVTAGGLSALECHHDRVREFVYASLEPERASGIHRALAHGLEASRGADPEELFVHFAAAGFPEHAASYAVAAADRASEAFAFERAARLYEQALELGESDDAQVHRLRVALADALANAGRGARAAEAYRAAIVGAGEAERLELRRRAAEQLLQSGHIDEGLVTLREVLSQVGMRLARSPRRALILLVLLRIWLKIRGLRYRSRDASAVAATELTRIDVCWSVASGLGVVDNVRATQFQTQHTLLALRAGEPWRVCRALAAEACFRGLVGGAANHRAEKTMDLARQLSTRLNRPDTTAWVAGFSGFLAYYGSRWRRAYELLDEGATIMREQCSGLSWEGSSCQCYALYSLFQLGELAEMDRQLPTWLREADDRGDLYFSANLRAGYTNASWLVRDDPLQARAVVEDVMARWSRKAFHVQHWFAMRARALISLYEGNGRQAWAEVQKGWKPLWDSMLLRLQATRIVALHLHASCALAAAAEGQDTAANRRIAARDVRALRSEKQVWASALADLLTVADALRWGSPDQVVDRLRRATSAFDEADMALLANVARDRLARVLGGEEGKALATRVEDWMRDQGVVKPAHFGRTVVPDIE